MAGIRDTTRTNKYSNPDDSAGPFAFDFDIIEQSDIKVYIGRDLLDPADYNVTINSEGGGSVTLDSATSETVTLIGGRELSRVTAFSPGGPFSAEALERELDSLTIQVQQLKEELRRCIIFNPGTPYVSHELPERDGKEVLAIHDNGTPYFTNIGEFDGVLTSPDGIKLEYDGGARGLQLGSDPNDDDASGRLFFTGGTEETTYAILSNNKDLTISYGGTYGVTVGTISLSIVDGATIRAPGASFDTWDRLGNRDACDARFQMDTRLGRDEFFTLENVSNGFIVPDGDVITGIETREARGEHEITGFRHRSLQKKIGGIWVTVSIG